MAKKDSIVGGKKADENPPKSSSTKSASTDLVVSPAFTIQDRLHKDIFEMYEAGVSPTAISTKYPLYTPKEVLELCASQYDLSQVDSDQLDAVLLKGFQRDLVRLNRVIEDNKDNVELVLDASKVLLDARERTVKFRQLLTPKLSAGQMRNKEPDAPISWTIEQRIITIIKSKPPAEANALLEKLNTATEEELNQILEAEFRDQGTTYLASPSYEEPEGPPDPNTIIG